MSQKKLAEIIETKFGAPFLECVNGLQNATDISDVLDTILGFSAVYMSNQQVLQQPPEDHYLEDTYFYDMEVIMIFFSTCRLFRVSFPSVIKINCTIIISSISHATSTR